MLKLFVNPSAPIVKAKVEPESPESEIESEKESESPKREPEIKAEYHSEQVPQVAQVEQDPPVERWDEVQEEPDVERRDDRIMVPGIACNFDSQNLIQNQSMMQQQLPQVFSPWYHNFNRTPTFSPSPAFIINVPNVPNANQFSFSNFDANLANQFYFPNPGDNQ